MALSQIMSNPNDINWLSHPYEPDNFFVSQTETLPFVISTNNNLRPEQGRIAKPVRKRARASRRTPTTLLTTDTTNFRAMVQHFTGGGPNGSAPFAAMSQPRSGGSALNFMTSQHMIATATTTTTNMAAAPAGGFRAQYPNNQPQQRHMFMMDHNMHGSDSGGLSPQAAAAMRGSSAASEDRNYDNNYML